MAQMPVAVVSEVSVISGMWPWWTVVTGSTAPRTNAAIASLPRVMPSPSVWPSRISADMSMMASLAKTWANPAQSFVSMHRK
jgi:hypothetical protein